MCAQIRQMCWTTEFITNASLDRWVIICYDQFKAGQMSEANISLILT